MQLASAFRWTNVAQFHLRLDRRRSVKCGHLRWGGLWASVASPYERASSVGGLSARLSMPRLLAANVTKEMATFFESGES